MRAIVYGVRESRHVRDAAADRRRRAAEEEWRWHVSIAPEADAEWWHRRGAEALWVAKGGWMPLGRAVELRDKLAASRSAATLGVGGRWAPVAPAAGWKPDEEAYRSWMRRLEGRLLLREEIERMDGVPQPWSAYVQWGALDGRVRLRCGAERSGTGLRDGIFRLRRIGLGAALSGGEAGAGRWRGYRCVRCGSGHPELVPSYCALCGGLCPYCEGCLAMGRVRHCALLVQGLPGSPDRASGGSKVGCLPESDVQERWGLSAAQADAAQAALQYLEKPDGGMFLLWAVTGAGKTEMMFPLVERTLASGGRALVATPRKDVVLELAPRFKAAFPDVRVVTLYGGSEERWDVGAITIATTHQLFRFREAFELVVLDEIDAFPYHGDPMLAYAAEQARVPGGAFVMLSATPPARLRKEARRGRLRHARVCARFHGHPLPVPQRIAVPPLRAWAGGAMPRRLREAIAASLARGAQLFLFVPRIDLVEGTVRSVQAAFPGVPAGGTSSQDPDRSGKVTGFRKKELRVIVTTTILERGVTVPKTDVFILDADSGLFDMASLVQMAGRAGRKKEDPHGFVRFCSSNWTIAQKQAIRDIRAMNREARKKGYLVAGRKDGGGGRER